MKLIGENWKASVLQNDMKIVKLKNTKTPLFWQSVYVEN